MTRDQAIELILLRCGMRQNDKVLQRACILEMQLAQQNILEKAAFKPWFLLSENVSTITFGSEERIPLPKGFLREYDKGCLWSRPYFDDQESTPGYKPLPFVEIRKLDYEQAQARYSYIGRPAVFAVVGNYFTVHPTPQDNFMLKMRYYKAEPVILEPYGEPGDVVTNKWLEFAPSWLIGETGKTIAAQYIKDAATAQIFAQQASEARQILEIEHVARDEANRSRSMGDD